MRASFPRLWPPPIDWRGKRGQVAQFLRPPWRGVDLSAIPTSCNSSNVQMDEFLPLRSGRGPRDAGEVVHVSFLDRCARPHLHGQGAVVERGVQVRNRLDAEVLHAVL